MKKLISPPKERCSRIVYDNNFHIDVPAYHLNGKADMRTLATQTKGWEKSDPKKLFVWFRNKFEKTTSDKARRQVRYMKCWAGLKYGSDRPSSTLLTVLVAEAIPGISAEIMASDDDALFAILSRITGRLGSNRKVKNPVEDEDLAGQLSETDFTVFLERLSAFEKIGAKALDCETAMEAAEEWSKAFEHFFPLPEESKKTSSVFVNLPAITTIPDVHVRAVSGSDDREWTGHNKIGPIPKGCDIYFEIQNQSSFPKGSAVHWMVRNEGAEAEAINDLGHKATETGFINKESSAYKGTHFMDCTVRQYGRIIGFRRIPVTIMGDFKPKEIKKKPFYKFRGRR